MIDTVHIWVGHEVVRELALIERLPELVSSYSASFRQDGTFEQAKGKWKGMRVACTEAYFSIQGSLAKMWLGNNLENLDIQSTQEAFQIIESHFGIGLNQFQVSRIDVGWNIVVDHSPELYFTYLGEA